MPIQDLIPLFLVAIFLGPHNQGPGVADLSEDALHRLALGVGMDAPILRMWLKLVYRQPLKADDPVADG